jgi:hypothetical protein
MLNLRLKRKVPVKVLKVELLKNTRHFSVWQLLLFVAVFAGIGGYIIYRSFATTTTTTSTWPFVSAFGDRNCISYGTSNNSSSGICKSSCTGGHSGADSCGGSCVVDSSGNTGTCRPRTIAICGGQPESTLISNPVDQGVDFSVDVPLNCGGSITYNNPNPQDTQPASYDYSKNPGMHKQVFNTPVYAMGNGVITCVAANPAHDANYPFHEYLMLTQKCRGGNVPIGDERCFASDPNTPIPIAQLKNYPNNVACNPRRGTGTWLVYKLTSGTKDQGKGLKIYIAEGCNLSRHAVVDATTGKMKNRRWKAGDYVTKNSVLCEVSNGTIEMGWANEGRQHIDGYTLKNEVEPAAYSCFQVKVERTWGYAPTVWGHSFNEFLHKSGPPAADAGYFRVSGANGGPYHSCSSYPMQSKYKGSWYNANAP